MSPTVLSLLTFAGAAGILTITPGLDTALVLRTAATSGTRQGCLAGLGIATGCFIWAALVAFGVGELLEASALAYETLRWLGAIYLIYVGLKLLRAPRGHVQADIGVRHPGGERAFLRGVLTNLLNPKVGIFYVSFLPQFVPRGVPAAPFLLLLGLIHVLLGLVWFVALIFFTHLITPIFERRGIVRTLDRITGSIFIAFGLGLAFRARQA